VVDVIPVKSGQERTRVADQRHSSVDSRLQARR
jgi:hypothetical protein